MNELRCKVLVIGGGPGGYVAAIRAGQLGLDTILVEAGRLGGACLNVGCIPSKALIHAAGAAHEPARAPRAERHRAFDWAAETRFRPHDRLEGFDRHAAHQRRRRSSEEGQGADASRDGDDRRRQDGDGSAPTPARRRIVAEHLVLATGSEPVELAPLKFGGDILSSTDALALTEVPQSLAVVGAGYIGMELGIAFAKLGAKVTIVEALPKILPLYDPELTQPVVRRLADLGVETLVGARAHGVRQWRAQGRGRGRQGARPSPPTRCWSRLAGARIRPALASRPSI